MHLISVDSARGDYSSSPRPSTRPRILAAIPSCLAQRVPLLPFHFRLSGPLSFLPRFPTLIDLAIPNHPPSVYSLHCFPTHMARSDPAARVYSSNLSSISASSTSSSSTIKQDKHQQQNSRATSGAPRPPRAQPPPTMPARGSAKPTSTTRGSAPEGPTPAALIAAKYRRDRQAQRSAVASPSTPQGEDIPPLLDEKTAIEGLHRLLQAVLSTVKEIEPVMRQAAEGDLQVATPALGLLWAALRIQTKSPVIVLPTADWDNNLANSFPTAREVRHVRGPLLTVETCPLSLRPLFQVWCNIVPRVQALSPRLQSEVARIICDLEPLEFPLVPQVSPRAISVTCFCGP